MRIKVMKRLKSKLQLLVTDRQLVVSQDSLDSPDSWTSSTNWENYEIYDPGVFGPPHTLPRPEARAAYKRLMAAKSARIEMLRRLMQDNGVELESSDIGLLELNAWFFENLEPDPDNPGRLWPEWYSVVVDIGLFLGEVMIARRPELYWEFYIWGKKNVAYQEAVIMGLYKSNPKVNMDIIRMIAGYGHRIVASRGSIGTHGKVTVRGVEIDLDAAHANITDRQIVTDWFLRWVKIAESDAERGSTDAVSEGPSDEVDPSSSPRNTADKGTPQAFVDELAKVGIAVASPWDLVNTRQPYPAAIPVLLDWLERVDSEVSVDDRGRFREGVVRALAVPEARGVAAPALIRVFRRAGEPRFDRWAVGNSLEIVARDAVFDEVVALAEDRSYGRDRQMIVLGLGRMKNPRAVEVLIGLLDDDDVAGHAVIALGRLKAPQARSALEPFLDHSRPWVRKEAMKALAKLRD